VCGPEDLPGDCRYDIAAFCEFVYSEWEAGMRAQFIIAATRRTMASFRPGVVVLSG
jgi:hypothetical protein